MLFEREGDHNESEIGTTKEADRHRDSLRAEVSDEGDERDNGRVREKEPDSERTERQSRRGVRERTSG